MLNKIIVFSGTDGSGKTTQIKLLINELKKKGFSTKYLWARGGYTPLFLGLKKILKIFLFKKNNNFSRGDYRTQLFSNKFLTKLWLTISILDLIIFYVLYLRLVCRFKNIIICDRYIEDTLIDFKRNFKGSFNDSSFLWKLLVLIAPKPNQHFLLYVPVNVSHERSKLKAEPFPDTIESLAFRLRNYLDETIFSSEKYCKIECQKSIENVNAIILNKIKELI